MLVVSPSRFNAVMRALIVLPITTVGNVARTRAFAASLTGAGTRTTGVVRCDQPRALDLAARVSTKLERLPDEITAEVLARLAEVVF